MSEGGRTVRRPLAQELTRLVDAVISSEWLCTSDHTEHALLCAEPRGGALHAALALCVPVWLCSTWGRHLYCLPPPTAGLRPTHPHAHATPSGNVWWQMAGGGLTRTKHCHT